MSSHTFSRRQFLQSSAVLSAAATAPSIFALQSNASAPNWAAKTKRWAQLTLVEDDPGTYDPKFWLDYFKSTHSDGSCISGGGCVAYYPTQVPFHHRSQWLGNADPLGDLVSGSRKMGMAVLIRTDPHATYDDAAAAHPDWIAVDASGKPRRHWASPEMWVTCGLGPYNFEFMTAVHNEIMTRYRPDGIFLNRWDGSGDCFCVHCTQNFKAATGFDLPRTEDPQDPARKAYILWRQQRITELLTLWQREISAINPNSAIIPNNGSGATIRHNSIPISKQAPMLVADRQARAGVMAPWILGKTAKEYRATLGRKPMAGLFGVGLEEPYRWKDSVQSDAEIRIWALEAIANGVRPWFSKFSATLHDERWLPVVQKVYDWAYKNERYLAPDQPVARIAIVYSQQTHWFYGGKTSAERVEAPALGWCQALVESRIPFEMVHDRLLDPEHINQFQTLILPNIAALSTQQCEQLKAFVQNGGSIIATSETSLYDELGVRRDNFALADLFAVNWTGKSEGPILNSYLNLEHQANPTSPIFDGLQDAPRIINGTRRLLVIPTRTFTQSPLTLIPSYPDLPMEKVFPRQKHTNDSQLYLREIISTSGNRPGRVAYFPWDIDRTFWEILDEDHLKLMRNTVRWATNEPAPIEVKGPGFLDVTVWKSNSLMVVHIVNLTNPMAMKGPYRDFFPVGEQTITLRLPKGSAAKSARLLVAEKPTTLQHASDTITFKVPSILDHEVIAIEI